MTERSTRVCVRVRASAFVHSSSRSHVSAVDEGAAERELIGDKWVRMLIVPFWWNYRYNRRQMKNILHWKEQLNLTTSPPFVPIAQMYSGPILRCTEWQADTSWLISCNLISIFSMTLHHCNTSHNLNLIWVFFHPLIFLFQFSVLPCSLMPSAFPVLVRERQPAPGKRRKRGTAGNHWPQMRCVR